jgi:hypothetical protein
VTPDKLPPGFAVNTPAQNQKMGEAATAALGSVLDSGFVAVALVFATPDGTVSAALAGSADHLPAIAAIMASGPDVLRETVKRMLAGKGNTRIVPR